MKGSMKTAVYSAHARYDQTLLLARHRTGAHELVFLQDRLDAGTAQLAAAARPWRPSSTTISVRRAGAARVGAGRAFLSPHALDRLQPHRSRPHDAWASRWRVADYSPYSVAEFAGPAAGGQPQDRTRQRAPAKAISSWMA
jgi:D-lactate dehydrogenase